MSISTAGLTAYTDEMKMDLIHKSVVGATSMSYMNIQSGVKESATINIIDTAVTFADDGCTRVATDSTPLTQRTITVGDIAVHEDICPKSLKGFYTQTMLGAGSLNGEDALPFEQIYWEHKANLIAEALETGIWTGDTASTVNNVSYFDGFAKVIDAGSPIDGNTGAVTTTTGITSANIIALLWGVYNSIPEAILQADDLVCFVGIDTFRLYQEAIYLGNLFHYKGDEGRNNELALVGTDFLIVGVAGLSGTDRMFAGRRSNFYVGTDLEGEEEQFRSWYSDDDRILKFTMAFKMGVQVAFDTEVVEFSLV